MRVGLIIYGHLDIVSGGYLYDRKLVSHLRARGDEVRIFSLPWRTYASHMTDNFRSHFIDQLVSAEIDILLQDELNHPSLFWLNRRLRQRVNYPIISIVHNLRCLEPRAMWQNRLYRQIERAYFETLDGVICNSATTLSAVRAISPKRLAFRVAQPAGNRLLPFATDNSHRKESAEFRLLFVATVTPLKGLHTLLAALETLPNPNWTLRVVGDLTRDPAYVNAMRARVTTLGWQDRITFCGILDGAELAHEYVSSDLFVLPSGYEGFGIVLLEAMGFGLPVIGTTRGAMHELIVDGQTGYLVSAENPQALAQKITLLHDNVALRTELSANALRHFATFPTWEESCAQMRQFLCTFLARASSGCET